MSMHEFSKIIYQGTEPVMDPNPGCESLCNYCLNQLGGEFSIPCQVMESRKDPTKIPEKIASEDCPYFKLDVKQLIKYSSKRLLAERLTSR